MKTIYKPEYNAIAKYGFFGDEKKLDYSAVTCVHRE